MKPRRGRTTALVILILGFGSAGAAAIAWRDRIAEHWWIGALRSGEESQRREAIARLGAMCSRRAIQPLIDVIQASFDPRAPQEYLFSRSRECSLERNSRIENLREWRGSIEHDAVIALAQAGEAAAPALIEAMRDWNAAEKGRLAAMLGLAAESLADPGRHAPWAAERSLASLAPAARKLLEDKDPKVIALAGWALETIR